MTDADLRACIRAAALEVYEAALPPDASCFEIHFAAGTLQRLTHELRLRCVDAEPASAEPAMLPA